MAIGSEATVPTAVAEVPPSCLEGCRLIREAQECPSGEVALLDPKGTNTKVTSAKGHFCVFTRSKSVSEQGCRD